MRNTVLTAKGVMAAALLLAANASAQPPAGAPAPPMRWTTLGTAGGPLVEPDRSQPANLLVIDNRPWLVDCGDGASERLAAAGYVPAQVDTVFISHLHVDHTAGLLGLIGLRWFTRAPHPLTIYGPPGTDKLVAGIVQALQPAMRIGIGVQGAGWGRSVADMVEVRIIEDGADLTLGDVRVRAVKNSHFVDPDGRDADNGSQPLSFRFDRNGYAVGFTGDTGPSAAVAALEQGVDLLVSEVIDIGPMTAAITRGYPDMPAAAKQSLLLHFRTQHLTPDEAGKLATQAHAKRLVLTHLTALGKTSAFESRLAAEVGRSFRGPVQVAHDLDRF